ncbi:MAG TPA: ATP-binding cassette domain-containing protein [Chloroflexota bacterium]|nr:ATP-binding cassette domain-containing protein [Chloroflexota bacterium]
MLSCRSVAFRFDAQSPWVLNNLDLTLAPGEFCTMLGHNGCGKSSLCRLLSGIYLPSTGSIELDGVGVGALVESGRLPTLVHLVLHDPHWQIIGDSVSEDIELGLRNVGLSGQALMDRVDWSLSLLDIDAYRHRSVHGLSGGELQLVRLAGAIAVQPRFLILDEALAMIDGARRRRILGTLRALTKELQISVLLTSHDVEDIVLADRVLWLQSGRIAMDEPCDTALQSLVDAIPQPFDIPAVASLAVRLRGAGEPVSLTLDVEQLVDDICSLNCET